MENDRQPESIPIGLSETSAATAVFVVEPHTRSDHRQNLFDSTSSGGGPFGLGDTTCVLATPSGSVVADGRLGIGIAVERLAGGGQTTSKEG